VRAGTLQVDGAASVAGRLTANEYLEVRGVGTQGATCSGVGMMARASDNRILSCQSGRWQYVGSGLVTQTNASCPTGLIAMYQYGTYKEAYLTIPSGETAYSNKTGWLNLADMNSSTVPNCHGGGDGGINCAGTVPQFQWLSTPTQTKCG